MRSITKVFVILVLYGYYCSCSVITADNWQCEIESRKRWGLETGDTICTAFQYDHTKEILSFTAANLRLQFGPWAVFVGDSDTRGLVLMLLQATFAAGFGCTVHGGCTCDSVLLHRHIWMGSVGDTPEFIQKRRSQCSRSDSPCCARCMDTRAHFLDVWMDSTGQIKHIVRGGEGETAPPHIQRAPEIIRKEGFRFTFVMATTMVSHLAVVKGLVQHMQSGLFHGDVTTLYLQTGAWGKGTFDDSENYIAQLNEVIHPLLNLTFKAWGTTLNHRKNLHVSGYGNQKETLTSVDLSPQMRAQKGWFVLDRSDANLLVHDSNISQLSSGHMPHLVNYIHFLRLANEAGKQRGTNQKEKASANGVQRKVKIAFSPQCAGRAHSTCALPPRNEPSNALEHLVAWQGWCNPVIS